MVDQSRRDRVGLGLIGLGPCWEQFYREPILRMQSRLTVKLVYDPVEARAKSVASEFAADIAGSLRQMLSRHSLQGLIVLDPGWCRTGIVDLIARSGKPTLLARPTLRQAAILTTIVPTNSAHPDHLTYITKIDDCLMPELGLRFTPSSCRLRELIATKLGPAKKIDVECNLEADIDETAAVIDWCCHILGQFPIRQTRTADETTKLAQIQLDFPPHPTTGVDSASPSRTATLKHVSADSPLRIHIECERGRATLTGRTHIVWNASTISAEETLTDERAEIEILIDQFCRRALGGLNPIGRLSEYARAMDIARSIE